MQNPTDAMRYLSDQMSWLQQFMGEDFWGQVQEAARAGQGTAGSKPGQPGGGAGAPQRSPAGFPPVEAYVTATEVVVVALVPGLHDHGQVSLGLSGPKELVLEVYLPGPAAHGVVLHRELPSGYCARTVSLPVPVSAEGTQAVYRDGCLEIRLRRTEPGARPTEVTLLRPPSM